jgi:UDP-galactopyranose mutase
VISRETSRDCQPGDTPYYPLRLATEKALLARYIRRARTEQCVSFVGRLGTYRYIDMHVTIAEALDWADRWRSDGLHELPALNVDPLA